jgi:hypothetical protein
MAADGANVIVAGRRAMGAQARSAGAAAPDSTAQLGSAAGPVGATVAVSAGAADSTTALRDLDHLGKTSALPAGLPRQPDAVSGTAHLRLPGQRRPTLVAVRIAVAAVCVAFGLSILAAAYRAAWLAAHVATPNLIGRTVADAGSTAQGLRLGLLVTGKRQDPNAPFGVVVAQNPAPGTDVAKGTVINLTVSEGSGSVPDLRGQTIQQAEGMLERVGLRLGQVSYTFDDQVTSGRIIYQFQLPGAQLGPNAGVDVLVSQGAPPFPFGPGPPGPPGRGPKGAGDHEHGH